MEILKSQNHEMFSNITGNRDVNKGHVKRLREAIESNPYLTKYDPILVNEKYQILDGQHRFEALKETKMPVYYIVAEGLGLETAQLLNSRSRVWSPTDFAKSYAKLGYKDYQTYLDFKEKYKFSHSTLINYLADWKDRPDAINMKFRSGDFKIKDLNKSILLSNQLMEVGGIFEDYKRRDFTIAFKILANNKYYSHERFLHKLKLKVDDIGNYNNSIDYLRKIEEIYNYRVSEPEIVRVF